MRYLVEFSLPQDVKNDDTTTEVETVQEGGEESDEDEGCSGTAILMIYIILGVYYSVFE